MALTPHRHRHLHRSVVVCLVAAAAVACLRTVNWTFSLDPAVRLPVSRYASLRGRVPAETPIGFTTAAAPGTAEAGTRHMLVRYALAPVRLEADDRLADVLADFDTDADLAAYVARVGGVIVEHPAPGLALVTRPPVVP